MKTKSDSSFILHPSSLPMRPYALRPTPHALPGGMSLLEVLIAMGVLTLGLLGILSVIPLAQYSLRETNKSDAAITCGRSALSEIKVRRLADFRWWYWQAGNWAKAQAGVLDSGTSATAIGYTLTALDNCNLTHPIILDPLGYAKLHAATFAIGLPVPDVVAGDPATSGAHLFRYTVTTGLLNNTPYDRTRIAAATAVFDWKDDLAFQPPQSKDERPTVFPSGLNYDGNYSWFATLMPSSEDTATWGGLAVLPVSSRRIFDVSTVVCYKRDFSVDSDGCPTGEWTANVNSVAGFGYGGGTIELSATVAPYLTKSGGTDTALPEQATLRENNWVMIWARNTTNNDYCCHWYRVVNADFESSPATVTLEGSDWNTTRWNPANSVMRMWVVKGVIGVYNSRIELDNDSIFGGQQ